MRCHECFPCFYCFHFSPGRLRRIRRWFSGLCHYENCLNDFYYPLLVPAIFRFFFPFPLSRTHTQNKGKLLSAHNTTTSRRKEEKSCFHVVLSMMESQGQERIQKTGGKTYANSEKLFSAFPPRLFIVFCVYYPCRSEMERRQEHRAKGWEEKVSFALSDCFATNLASIYKSLSFSLLRLRNGTLLAFFRLVSRPGEVQINFVFRWCRPPAFLRSSVHRGHGIYEHDAVRG